MNVDKEIFAITTFLCPALTAVALSILDGFDYVEIIGSFFFSGFIYGGISCLFGLFGLLFKGNQWKNFWRLSMIFSALISVMLYIGISYAMQN